MKKLLVYFIIIIFIIITIKYCFSNYNIDYVVSGYNVKTNYNNGRFYYEIYNDDLKFNFDYYKKRSLSKTKIDSIIEINNEEIKCIYPKIKNVETYPLCYVDGVFTDYNLIDSELLEKYKSERVDVEKSSKDFIFYNNLNKDEYVALWNYNGYIVMNGSSYKNIKIFNKEKYDNSLSFILDSKIYMANYDDEHEYTSLKVLDLKNNDINTINLKNNIDFDSYFVGNIKNNIYIYDDKYSKLYEINIKNKKVNIIGDNEKGFIKYENGKMVPCSKNEYKVNKIKFNNTESNYSYSKNNGIYKVINNNKSITEKILNTDVSIIKEYKNNIYYVDKDDFYLYSPLNGSKKIFYNYELTFNTESTIYVYNDN